MERWKLGAKRGRPGTTRRTAAERKSERSRKNSLVPVGLMGLCVLLLACSDAALKSASQALDLWWTRVLPALFPFFVLTSWMHRFGLLSMLQNRLHSPFTTCFLLGAISGYPTGARVCAMLGQPSYAAYCNLCSPMFLLGVVAAGMFGNSGLIWPLALSHYGSALIMYLMEKCLIKRTQAPPAAQDSPQPGPTGNLFSDVANGMQAMLNIGGCILIFYVPVNTLLTALFGERFPLINALLDGVFELTSGCRHVAELGLPTPIAMGIAAFFVTFGGLCVFGQAMMVADIPRPLTYLTKKAAQGFLAAILCYLLTPLLVPSVVTALNNNAQSYGQNALMGLTFIASAVVGLMACYLLALVLRQPRPNITSGKSV